MNLTTAIQICEQSGYFMMTAVDFTMSAAALLLFGILLGTILFADE